MVHKHTLFLLGVLACIAGNAKGDMSSDYCRYQFHVQPLNWMAARNVCSRKNQTLLKVNDDDELSSIVKMAKDTVYQKLPGYPYSSSEIWVGLRAQKVDGSMRHNWENCDLMTKNDAAWGISNYDTITGCVAVMLSETKYNVFDCIHESRPYICEAASQVPCYDEVTWISEPAFSSLTDHNIIESPSDCDKICMTDSFCIGFQASTKCKMVKYANALPAGLDLDARNVAYSLGFIDLKSYTGEMITSTSNMCTQSSSSPQVQSTSSYLPFTTIASSGVTSMDLKSETSLPMSEGIVTSLKSLSFDTQDLTTLFCASSTPELTLVSDIVQTFPSSEESAGTDQASLLHNKESSKSSLKQITSEEIKLAIESSTGLYSFTPAVSSDHSSLNNTGCLCPCSMYKNTTYTPKELENRIKEIKEKLTVDRKKTSIHKRTLISAPDERLSVKRIGYVGVVVMITICGILVLMDMPRSVTCLKDFLQKCK